MNKFFKILLIVIIIVLLITDLFIIFKGGLGGNGFRFLDNGPENNIDVYKPGTPGYVPSVQDEVLPPEYM